MKKLLLLSVFGLAANAIAQSPNPDSTADSLPVKPKIDTVIVEGKDTLELPAAVDTPGKQPSTERKSLASGKDAKLRSPSGALLRSLTIPGWGQIYNRKYFKAVIVAGGQGVLLGTAVVEWKRASDSRKDMSLTPAERLEDYRLHTNNRNLFLWLYAAATVVSMLDAYVDAHLSQDTGEGVPKIGEIILEPEPGKKTLLLKLRFNF